MCADPRCHPMLYSSEPASRLVGSGYRHRPTGGFSLPTLGHGRSSESGTVRAVRSPPRSFTRTARAPRTHDARPAGPVGRRGYPGGYSSWTTRSCTLTEAASDSALPPPDARQLLAPGHPPASRRPTRRSRDAFESTQRVALRSRRAGALQPTVRLCETPVWR